MVALSIIDAATTSWDLVSIQTQIQGILHSSMVRKSHVFREANTAADYLANLGLVMGAAILHPHDIKGRLNSQRNMQIR